MIFNHVNHKMPIYKDCTLGEMLFVGISAFLSLSIVLSLVTKLLLGFAWIGFAAAILSIVHVTRLLLGQLQKIKYGKPDGYYRQLLLKNIDRYALFRLAIKLPYLQRHGKWSVRRR